MAVLTDKWCDKCKDYTTFTKVKETTLLVGYKEDESEDRVGGYEGQCKECGFEDAWVDV